MHTLLLLIAFALLQPVAPPDAPPALVVQLRDTAGVGVARVIVTVRDARGQADLAHATTNDAGVATFATLPAADIRVVVRGALPNGAALILPGNDARGIPLVLDAPPTRLDLRVEADGLVRPDPATMITPDVGIALAADELPTLPLPPTVAPATATIEAIVALPLPTVPGAPRSTETPQPRALPGLLVALTVLLLAMLVLVLGLRRSR
jgi:hypothetical protein